MSTSDPPGSPWRFREVDTMSREILIEIPFDEETHELQNGYARRDPNCTFRKIYIGIDVGVRAFPLPVGATPLPARALELRGIGTLDDLLALQVTAGP